MANTTKDLTTLQNEMTASAQGQSSALLDFSVGSIMLAIINAFAAVVLWLQAQILSVSSKTRASTSHDADLDSWMADFNFPRDAASPASGNETFTRYTTTGTASLAVGAQVQTANGSAIYAVMTDSGNPHYDAATASYIIPDGTASVTVPIQALVAGSAGNALAGLINTSATAIPGFDTYTNAAALTNGTDGESDAAYRARFVLWINSLSKGTETAIAAAILGVQSNLQYVLVENEDTLGNPDPGYFYAVIDDGSGVPSDELVAAVTAAIALVRGFTIGWTVIKPTVLDVPVELTITVASGYTGSSVRAAVQNAITNYVNTRGLGNGLPYTRIAQVAYDASPGVANVINVLLNGGTSDIAGSPKQAIRTTSVTVH
jgi:uncharacterized phage protein gp47/JayE